MENEEGVDGIFFPQFFQNVVRVLARSAPRKPLTLAQFRRSSSYFKDHKGKVRTDLKLSSRCYEDRKLTFAKCPCSITDNVYCLDQ